MRNPVCLLELVCAVPLLTVCGGCGRDISDEELGHVITDMSLVPGTAEPYELPDLSGGDEMAPAEPSGHNHAHQHHHPQDSL